jgi:hypothetical protein
MDVWGEIYKDHWQGVENEHVIEPEHIQATQDCDLCRDIPILLFVEAAKARI